MKKQLLTSVTSVSAESHSIHKTLYQIKKNLKEQFQDLLNYGGDTNIRNASTRKAESTEDFFKKNRILFFLLSCLKKGKK